jgi:hypothetical protein
MAGAAEVVITTKFVPVEPPAANLFATPNTLKTHLRAIYRKLGAESREEAVIRAREGGLI